MILTEENYYGREAAQKYMSVSQFKAFLTCPAAAMAELNGLWKRPETTALLVGSYVDAKLEGSEPFERFVSAHPEIFRKDGSLKSEFAQAEKIYQRILSDRLLSLLLSGRKQVILQGEIAGVPFKGKIDSLLDVETCQVIMKEFPQTIEVLGGPFCIGAIVDGKVMRNFEPVWSEEEGRKVSWVRSWHYILQGSAYQALEGTYKPFIIAGASKEPETDLTALYVSQRELEAGLGILEEYTPIYQEIKLGKRAPSRCEKCAYCRRTKKITSIKHHEEG